MFNLYHLNNFGNLRTSVSNEFYIMIIKSILIPLNKIFVKYFYIINITVAPDDISIKLIIFFIEQFD